MDTRIYIMTHKAFAAPQVKGYIPLHVGSAGKTNLGYLRDDVGEHISEKNPFYCELTGLYWVWKNVQCDIVGLCHYRRYFLQDLPEGERTLEEWVLPISYIEKCMQQYDLIVPNSGMTSEKSVREQYREHHHIADWEACSKVIREKYPRYEDAFLWNQDTNFISLGNMVIGKKSVIDSYCAWLFDILFELERRIEIQDYDDYQRRIFGFLSERLFRVWLLGNRLKIKEEATGMLE